MKPLLILFVVCIIDVLGFGILVPLVPYMADRFGAPPELITPILGSYSLFQLIAAPFWGRMSDRYGRRPILMLSLAGACVSYVILGLADTVEWLFVSRILAGFMAGNLAAAFAYASDVSALEDRAKALGLVGAAIGIGFMLGPAIGGLLAGDDIRTANFVLPALASIVLSLVAIALVHFVLPESHTAALDGKRPSPSGHRGPLRLLRERATLRYIAIAALLVTCAQAILESIFAIWALNAFGFGPRTVGIIMFGLALITVLMQGGLVRTLVPRYGERKLAVFGIGAFVAGLTVVALTNGHGLHFALFGLALCAVGGGVFNPSASALASRESSVSDRGAVMGTYQACSSLARVIGPFVSGPLYAALGPSSPFLAGALVMLPGFWLVWRTRRARSLAVPAG